MKDNPERIAILDGIRAYAVLIVMGFHLWQQSWLQNLFPSDLLRPLGVQHNSMTGLPRPVNIFVHGLH